MADGLTEVRFVVPPLAPGTPVPSSADLPAPLAPGTPVPPSADLPAPFAPEPVTAVGDPFVVELPRTGLELLDLLLLAAVLVLVGVVLLRAARPRPA